MDMEDGGAEVARAAAAAAEREEEERERAAVRSTLERFIMLVDTVEYESEEWAMLTQAAEAATVAERRLSEEEELCFYAVA